MKHNQFKHIVNQMIKERCKEYAYTMAGVDITNNSKMIYIYDKMWNCRITLSLWLNEKRIDITGSLDISRTAGLCNNQFNCSCSYLEFNKIYDLLYNIFKDS